MNDFNGGNASAVLAKNVAYDVSRSGGRIDLANSAQVGKPQTELERAGDELNMALSQLEMSVGELLGRLAPILKDLPPAQESAKDSSSLPIVHSRLGQAINNSTQRVRDTASKINLIHTLLAI